MNSAFSRIELPSFQGMTFHQNEQSRVFNHQEGECEYGNSRPHHSLTLPSVARTSGRPEALFWLRFKIHRLCVLGNQIGVEKPLISEYIVGMCRPQTRQKTLSISALYSGSQIIRYTSYSLEWNAEWAIE